MAFDEVELEAAPPPAAADDDPCSDELSMLRREYVSIMLDDDIDMG